MTSFQKTVKYFAIALAVFLTVSIIGGAWSVIGLIGGVFGNRAVDDEVKRFDFSSDDITSLEIDINAADFTIRNGDVLFVESNLKYLTVKEHDGILSISEEKKLLRNYNGAVLTLYIPSDIVFDVADITTGAGRMTVDALSAEALEMNVGAGDVNIEELNTNKRADIEGGAGRVTVSDGRLCNLDLKMGVGQLNLTSRLIGRSGLDLGVGESNITLLGDKDDYDIEVEKGIGHLTIDGEKVNDFGIDGEGENEVYIEGRIGAVNLSFESER